MPNRNLQQLKDKVKHHLTQIYPNHDNQYLTDKFIRLMRLDECSFSALTHYNHWSEQDIAVITYGSSIIHEHLNPLQTLHHFLYEYLYGVINTVHILPFFPYCADDGFSVIDYKAVNPALGTWADIERISRDFRLMSDLVLNHCSNQSQWFLNFQENQSPGKDYFFTVDDQFDTRQVVRPRTSPLLRITKTTEGVEQVWCTFSHHQVDLNFNNPKVLGEMVDIIRFYLDRGVKIFRFDAVAFIWKESGTRCINLPQAHEIVRLLRTLIEHAQPDAIIITETNVPNHENLTYFGNANEAHCIYNFSLPPLLLNSLITGNCKHLRHWLSEMPTAQDGTTYLNFIASHDGIGLRPAEGLLDDEELHQLITTIESFGGQISWRAVDDNGTAKAYEMNIALFDALKGTTAGTDQWQISRFVCAHAIMLGLQGIPAFYIHSLLGTENDYNRVEHEGHNRAINRHQWHYKKLVEHLEDKESHHHNVLNQIKNLITIRKQQKAFHPNANQYVLQLKDSIFAYWRQSLDRRQIILCIYNIADKPDLLLLSDINLAMETAYDLISGQVFTHNEINIGPYQSLWLNNQKQ